MHGLNLKALEQVKPIVVPQVANLKLQMTPRTYCWITEAEFNELKQRVALYVRNQGMTLDDACQLAVHQLRLTKWWEEYNRVSGKPQT